MVLLDLFCGAGGCSEGYHRAGFEVRGVDLHPQPNYPFPFERMDALDALACLTAGGPVCGMRLRDVDAVHASPPCQAYSSLVRNMPQNGCPDEHPDMVGPVRSALRKLGGLWVIENVIGSGLRYPLKLCGTMFGLSVRRHRLFESNVILIPPGPCRHGGPEVGVYGPLDGRRLHTRKDGSQYRVARNLGDARSAMGIGWMAAAEITQAIPPAYTECVGRQLAEWVRRRRRYEKLRGIP